MGEGNAPKGQRLSYTHAGHPEGGDAMKRNFIIGLFGLSAAALLGCPVFSGGGGSEPCGGQYQGACTCYQNSDCGPGYVCTDGYYCEPVSEVDAGFDGPFGDGGGGACDGGCSSGEVCAVVDGGAVCIAAPDGGPPADSAPPPFHGCTSNAACGDAGVGYICLDGKCVAPANQCTDSTQCPDSEQCVDGACVPACGPGSTNPCPTGYSCVTPGGDAGSGPGVCTGNPTPCGTADGGMKCAGGTTCVDQHCVPDCSKGKCSDGLVCVDNGCIPNQTPNFVCDKENQTPGTQDACDKGSICLHHNCYIACDGNPDASPGFCSTATGTKFPICKGVTESTTDGGTGTFFVCASSSNLGSDCDPTSTPPKTCATAGQVCIDGYCE